MGLFKGSDESLPIETDALRRLEIWIESSDVSVSVRCSGSSGAAGADAAQQIGVVV